MTMSPNSATPAALELRNVAKFFGAVVALASADLRVEMNSIHALVGKNGAGKEGDSFTTGDLGTLKVGPDNTVIVGPPTEFDANNIDKYNF